MTQKGRKLSPEHKAAFHAGRDNANAHGRRPPGRGVIPEELRRRIYHMHRFHQLSFTAIAIQLNDEHVPTSQGGRWYPATIKKILESELTRALIDPDSSERPAPPEASAAVKARVRALRNQGKSTTAIAKELTDANVPTPLGGTRWYWASVKRILDQIDDDYA